LYLSDSGFSVEGSSADLNETTVSFTNPTADRTITFPDATGNVAVFTTAPTAAITDGTAGQFLKTDGAGALSFATVSADLVNDTSPQLGGTLDTNGNLIQFGDSSSATDDRLQFGASQDLEIYHDGSNSYIDDVGDGSLRLRSNGFGVHIMTTVGTFMGQFTNNGAVTLYHNATPKFATTSTGIQTTGTVNVNGAYTLPTSDGTNGQVLSTNGAGAVTFVDQAGADLYAANESTPTAQPSATGANAIAIGDSATASGSDSIAIGIESQSTNSGSVALGKSQATGVDSFAAAIGDNTTNFGAKADNAIAIGQQTRANGTNAISIGYGGQAFGSHAVVIGRNSLAGQNAISIGGSNNCFGNNSSIFGGELGTVSSGKSYSIVLNGYNSRVGESYSVAIGTEAESTTIGKLVYASGKFSTRGDAQSGTYVLRSDTTNATAEALTTNNSTAGATNQIILQNESAMTFTGTVVVREDATNGDDYAGWEIKGVIMRQGTVTDTTLGVGIVNSLYHTAGLASASVALSADTTNGGLKIEVTGIAATNLNWVATVHTSEVVNA
jgi:hypothetical protein